MKNHKPAVCPKCKWKKSDKKYHYFIKTDKNNWICKACNFIIKQNTAIDISDWDTSC